MYKMAQQRYACLTDLNGYFKKSDLLSGLSELEKSQLRTNIGILNYTGEGGQSAPVELTYSALYDLVIRKTLVTGARYIITDYQTIYSSNVLNSSSRKITWGTSDSTNPSPIYKLLVIANSNDRLDSRAMILDEVGKDWIVEHNIQREVLPDDKTTKGKITFLKDSNGNSAYYDFKNIKFRRTQSELEGSNNPILTPYIDLYTFSDITNGTVVENSNLYMTKYNTLEENCWNNVFIGDTYSNIIQSGCQGNTFLKGIHDSILSWNSVNNLFNENVCYCTGSIYNKKILPGDSSLSMTITKTIHKVNEATIVSYLDPITYAYQIIIIR